MDLKRKQRCHICIPISEASWYHTSYSFYQLYANSKPLEEGKATGSLCRKMPARATCLGLFHEQEMCFSCIKSIFPLLIEKIHNLTTLLLVVRVAATALMKSVLMCVVDRGTHLGEKSNSNRAYYTRCTFLVA